jgi:hypothetical protein
MYSSVLRVKGLALLSPPVQAMQKYFFEATGERRPVIGCQFFQYCGQPLLEANRQANPLYFNRRALVINIMPEAQVVAVRVLYLIGSQAERLIFRRAHHFHSIGLVKGKKAISIIHYKV